MATELPRALLSCAECGARFKLTLKKGRPPSKPVPCPQCKTPITVTKEHIVDHGSKPAGDLAGGHLRETKPGDVLQQTQSPDDPPTAEVDLAESSVEELEPENMAPAFGIVHRKRSRSAERTPSNNNLGVAVVKNVRDNVYGQMKAGSQALARIRATRQPTVTPVNIAPESADLPALTESSIANNTPSIDIDIDVDIDFGLDDLDLNLEPGGPEDLSSGAAGGPEDLEPGGPEDLSSGAAGGPEDLEPGGPEDLSSGAADGPEDLEPGGPEDLSSGPADGPADLEPGGPEDLEMGGPEDLSERSETDAPEDADESFEDVVSLDIEASEGYELGDADLPDRPMAPRRGNLGGVVVGIVLLVILAAVVGLAFL